MVTGKLECWEDRDELVDIVTEQVVEGKIFAIRMVWHVARLLVCWEVYLKLLELQENGQKILLFSKIFEI